MLKQPRMTAEDIAGTDSLVQVLPPFVVENSNLTLASELNLGLYRTTISAQIAGETHWSASGVVNRNCFGNCVSCSNVHVLPAFVDTAVTATEFRQEKWQPIGDTEAEARHTVEPGHETSSGLNRRPTSSGSGGGLLKSPKPDTDHVVPPFTVYHRK